MLVERIDGDFYNVVGLPIAKVVRAQTVTKGRRTGA